MSPEPTPRCSIDPAEIHALAAGDLPPERLHTLHAHLPHCPACQSTHRQALELHHALAQLPSLPVPDPLAQRLATITQTTLPSPRRFPLVPLVATLALAASLALVFLLRPRTPSPQPITTTTTAADLERATRDLKIALAVLNATGRETADRATQKVIERGLLAPARHFTSTFLAQARRTTRPGPSAESPNTPPPPL